MFRLCTCSPCQLELGNSNCCCFCVCFGGGGEGGGLNPVILATTDLLLWLHDCICMWFACV